MSTDEEQNAHPSIDGKGGSLDQREVVQESKFTPEDERRLVRKLDWRIMPIACIMYLFACAYSLPSYVSQRIDTVALRRPRQNQLGERALARTTPRCAARRPDWSLVRLGQLGVLLFLREYRPPSSRSPFPAYPAFPASPECPTIATAQATDSLESSGKAFILVPAELAATDEGPVTY